MLLAGAILFILVKVSEGYKQATSADGGQWHCLHCGADCVPDERANVSDQAKTCVQCGAPLSKVRPKQRPGLLTWLLVGTVGAGIVAGIAQAPPDAVQAAKVKTPEQTAAAAKRTAQLQLAGAGALALKKAMKDPTAFELTSLNLMPTGAACYEYRAKNSFGATFPGSAIRTETGKLLVQEQHGNTFVAAWNKACTVAGGEDIAPFLKRAGVLE